MGARGGHGGKGASADSSDQAANPPGKKESSDKKPERKVKKLAETRGQDWGLHRPPNAVAITRPVRVECYSDRLILISERGTPVQSVPLGLCTEDSVDAFVDALCSHMESWGIAGRQMYWRPVLEVHVMHDGQQRFDELTVLLDDSGLEIQQKQ